MPFRKRLLLPSAAMAISLASLSGCGLGSGVRSMTGGLGQAAQLQLLPLKAIFRCIPEGTPVDTPAGPRPIEEIRPGDSVIGFGGDLVRVLQVHGYDEDATANRFLRIAFENGAEVRLCDRHRIDGIPAGELTPGNRVGGKKIARIEKLGGVRRSYDLLTEDEGYRISGMPVNSMIEEMLAAAAAGPGR